MRIVAMIPAAACTPRSGPGLLVNTTCFGKRWLRGTLFACAGADNCVWMIFRMLAGVIDDGHTSPLTDEHA